MSEPRSDTEIDAAGMGERIGAANADWIMREFIVPLRARVSELTAENERLEAARVELWECEDCGFGFDAIHTDNRFSHGYSCPNCGELAAEKERDVERARREAVEALIPKYKARGVKRIEALTVYRELTAALAAAAVPLEAPKETKP